MVTEHLNTLMCFCRRGGIIILSLCNATQRPHMRIDNRRLGIFVLVYNPLTCWASYLTNKH